jgi:phosphofructokinase-like protein
VFLDTFGDGFEGQNHRKRPEGDEMKVGVLTGGGDCPGLNAVIRAVVRKGELHFGDEFVGFADGWKGVIENATLPLNVERCRGILPRGGTILGSSRTNPYKRDDGPRLVKETLSANEVDALVAIGGEDTLGVANRLSQEGVQVVGVPKTIDNDLSATELTFGFHTAVQICVDAIDRLHTTAESHDRVMVCEVMGRHAGWIATYAGIAGGAAEILIPEEEFDINEVAESIKRRHTKGRYASIIVVAEGAKPKEGTMAITSGEVDAFGHVRLGGIGNLVAEQIEKLTGFETRVTILGHIQRGGTPTAFDRVLATRFGVHAIDGVQAGDFGTMVALRGTDIVRVGLNAATDELKTVPVERYAEAEVFFG